MFLRNLLCNCFWQDLQMKLMRLCEQDAKGMRSGFCERGTSARPAAF